MQNPDQNALTMDQHLKQKLTDGFQPSQLIIENQSHLHAHHASSPNNGSSHYFITIIADGFDGHSKIARQKLVYQLLKEEMAGPIHALSLRCLTPQEYESLVA